MKTIRNLGIWQVKKTCKNSFYNPIPPHTPHSPIHPDAHPQITDNKPPTIFNNDSYLLHIMVDFGNQFLLA
jgi:hypothetical protein